jgi:hypothetical protein
VLASAAALDHGVSAGPVRSSMLPRLLRAPVRVQSLMVRFGFSNSPAHDISSWQQVTGRIQLHGAVTKVRISQFSGRIISPAVKPARAERLCNSSLAFMYDRHDMIAWIEPR